jgi:outer membrane receptor for ferrienterochelin and colicins
MKRREVNRISSGRGSAIAAIGLGLAIILIAGSSAIAESGLGAVKGRVFDIHDGSSLPHTNVVIIGTSRGAASDRNGEFLIDRVPAGQYQVRASFVGFESAVKTVTIKPDEEALVEFHLRQDFFRTEQVVVTATRTQRLLEVVPVVTEVIDREEIEEKGAEDLSEILEDRPGIAIETGTTGDRFLYMNGVDSRRVAVLVDGLPLAGKLNNRIQLDLIDSDNIGHIEIVKGPGSALYGNDAMGGVINIITGEYPKALQMRANTRIGSNGLLSGGISLSGQKDAFGYAFRFDRLSEGSDKGSSEIDIKNTESTSLGGKVRLIDPFLGTLEVRAQYKNDTQGSESMFMGGTNQSQLDVDHLNSSLKWNRICSDRYEFQIVGYYTDNERTYQSKALDSPRPASVDTTTDNIVGIRSDFSFAANEMLRLDVGVDLSDNDYDNPRLGETQTRKQVGTFAQIETNPLENTTLVAGARYDKITDVDGHFSPRVSAMYSVTPALKLRASWGRGFRAPSFIELYSDFQIPIPGMPLMVVGNPDLKPEESDGGSLGIEYVWNDLLLVSTSYFQSEFKEMIVDYQTEPFTYSYLNVEKATFRTLELQTGLYLSKSLTATVSYNFTDVDQDEDDVAISKISPHTASLRVDYRLWKSLRLSLREQYFGERDILVVSGHGGELSTETKAGYNLADVTLSYKATDTLAFRFGTTNITDHTDKDYGPWVGRRVFLSISDTGFPR